MIAFQTYFREISNQLLNNIIKTVFVEYSPPTPSLLNNKYMALHCGTNMILGPKYDYKFIYVDISWQITRDGL